MSGIASHIGSYLSLAKSIIDRLVDKGLVERIHDINDRRVVIFSLTTLKQEVVERFWHIHQMQIETVAAALTIEELKTVLKAMGILSEAISCHADAATARPSTTRNSA